MSKSITGAGTLNLSVQELRFLELKVSLLTATNATVDNLLQSVNAVITGTLTVGDMSISGTFTLVNLTSSGTITANNVTASGTITGVGIACTNITASSTVTTPNLTTTGTVKVGNLTNATGTTVHDILLRDDTDILYKFDGLRFSPVDSKLYVPELLISTVRTIGDQDVGFILMEINGDVKKANGSFDNVTGRFTFPKITCTELTATTITGNLTGNTAGVHTGAVVGSVTGNTAGVHTGAVVGNVTGDVTATTITTGNIILTASQTISTPTDINCIMTIANNSTNRLERTSNSDLTFQESTGILKCPRLMVQTRDTATSDSFMGIALFNETSEIVSTDSDFKYNPSSNTLEVLHIGRLNKYFQLPNNTGGASDGWGLVINNSTATPYPTTTWAAIPSSSSFVTTDSTAQTILGTKTFSTSPVFNNISGSSANNAFTILCQNQGTFQMKHFVGDLSYNPFSETLSSPNIATTGDIFNGSIVTGYIQEFNDSIWLTSEFKNSKYYFGMNSSGVNAVVKWNMTNAVTAPTIYEYGQSFVNSGPIFTKGAWIMNGGTGAMSLADSSLSNTNWKVRVSMLFKNDSSGDGDDRYSAKIYIGKNGTTRLLTVDEGCEYVRHNSGLFSTIVCEGTLSAVWSTDSFYVVTALTTDNNTPWQQETSKYDAYNINISFSYLGKSTNNTSYGIASQ